MPRAAKPAAPQPDIESLLAPKQVAEMLGLTVGALAQMRYMGKGPHFVKVTGHQVRYFRADVQEWLLAQRQAQT